MTRMRLHKDVPTIRWNNLRNESSINITMRDSRMREIEFRKRREKRFQFVAIDIIRNDSIESDVRTASSAEFNLSAIKTPTELIKTYDRSLLATLAAWDSHRETLRVPYSTLWPSLGEKKLLQQYKRLQSRLLSPHNFSL